MGPTLPVVVARPLVGVAHPPGKGGPIREVSPRHVRHGTWIRILKLVVRVPPLQRRGGKAAALPFRRRLHPTRSSVFGIGGHWHRPRTQVDRHTANLFVFVVPHVEFSNSGNIICRPTKLQCFYRQMEEPPSRNEDPWRADTCKIGHDSAQEIAFLRRSLQLSC